MKIINLIKITLLLLSFLFFPSAFAQQPANDKIEVKGVSDRKIEALDMLMVHVFGESEFSGLNNAGLKLRVSSSGEVSLYLLGTIQVAGKTPSEAEKHIRSLLMKDFIRDPHVLVQVETYRVSNVTVMGQVAKPGLIPLPAEQRIDILAAIALAGGFTNLAKTSKIELTRGGITKNYDLDRLKKITDIKKKILLQSNDLVYVHESAF
jgi:polysaccharide export outer membrane protein